MGYKNSAFSLFRQLKMDGTGAVPYDEIISSFL